MIPKIIHYCWFGRGKKPEMALKCIDSWKKYCPDYEIKEWNEDNFPIEKYPYAKEALEKRKFAFVTDVVRLYALYTEGGIYMDTDVEVLKPLDDYLNNTAFSGFEAKDRVPTGIMGSIKGGKWAKDNLDYYNNRHFVKEDGSLDLQTNVQTITMLMVQNGLILNNEYQQLRDYITMYPNDFFCPKSWEDGKIYLTNRTVTIHHFSGSWKPKNQLFKYKIRKVIHNFKLQIDKVLGKFDILDISSKL